MEFGVWFLSPNSILVLELDPLNFGAQSSGSWQGGLKHADQKRAFRVLVRPTVLGSKYFIYDYLSYKNHK